MEERMRILRMLEAGEITVEEANKLLDELNVKNTGFQKQKEEFEEKVNDFVSDLGRFLKNTVKFVEEKIEEIFPNKKSE
jgi:polyhydroxyalkanoate synthesis regulator phasin